MTQGAGPSPWKGPAPGGLGGSRGPYGSQAGVGLRPRNGWGGVARGCAGARWGEGAHGLLSGPRHSLPRCPDCHHVSFGGAWRSLSHVVNTSRSVRAALGRARALSSKNAGTSHNLGVGGGARGRPGSQAGNQAQGGTGSPPPPAPRNTPRSDNQRLRHFVASLAGVGDAGLRRRRARSWRRRPQPPLLSLLFSAGPAFCARLIKQGRLSHVTDEQTTLQRPRRPLPSNTANERHLRTGGTWAFRDLEMHKST